MLEIERKRDISRDIKKASDGKKERDIKLSWEDEVHGKPVLDAETSRKEGGHFA